MRNKEKKNLNNNGQNPKKINGGPFLLFLSLGPSSYKFFCIKKLHQVVSMPRPCYMSLLHGDSCACFMSMLLVHVCPCCMCFLHVQDSCPCCISLLLVHATVLVGGGVYPCCISLLHVNSVYLCFIPCCLMSVLPVHAACPCCMSVLQVHAGCSSCMPMLHFLAACPFFMPKLYVPAACLCCMPM